MPVYAWVMIGIFAVIVVVGIVYSIRDFHPSHDSYHSLQKPMPFQEAQMKYWIMRLNARTGDTKARIKSRGPFDTREKALALATEMNKREHALWDVLSPQLGPDSQFCVLSDAEIEANQATGVQLEKLWIVSRRLDIRTNMQDGSAVKVGPYETEEEARARASEMNKAEDEYEREHNPVIRRRHTEMTNSEIERHRAAGDHIL